MSGAFRLTRALFVLDGAVQYNKQDVSTALKPEQRIRCVLEELGPCFVKLGQVLAPRVDLFGDCRFSPARRSALSSVARAVTRDAEVEVGFTADAPAHYFGVPAVSVRGADELESLLKANGFNAEAISGGKDLDALDSPKARPDPVGSTGSQERAPPPSTYQGRTA